MIFAGRSGPPLLIRTSPVSKSRANLLLIFQCPGICPIPSQVDILVSYDSLTFCPTMYNKVFTLGRDQSQIRIKNEVGTVKHVEALQFFFLLVQISLIVFLNLKNPVRYNHSNIYHDPAIGYSITCVDRCWRVGQWLQMHFTLTARVGICVR